MADIKKLLESIDKIAKEGTMSSAAKHKTGPKFGGYWKGTDPNTPNPGMGVGGTDESDEHFTYEEDKAYLGEPHIREGDAPLDPPGYALRVAELEAEGMTTSDAQGIADMEYQLKIGPWKKDKEVVDAIGKQTIKDEKCPECGQDPCECSDVTTNEGILDTPVEEKCGLRIGDTVQMIGGAFRGKQGHVLDLNFDGNRLEILFSGPDSGKTAVVDARDTEALDENYLGRMQGGATYVEDEEGSEPEHGPYCNCEDCCWARDGQQVCPSCGCTADQCPGHLDEDSWSGGEGPWGHGSAWSSGEGAFGHGATWSDGQDLWTGGAGAVAEDEEYQDSYEDEDSELYSGCYVRDEQNDGPRGEIFKMIGDPYERRVRIADKDGRGWNISPSRLTKVDDNDPDIGKWFPSEDNEDEDEMGDYGFGRSTPKGDLDEMIGEAKPASLMARVKDVAPGDQVSKDKQGNFVFRKGYYYRMGMNSQKFADRVKEELENAGLTVEIIDHGDHFAAFRGGASIKESSHFWVKARITDTASAPVTTPIEEADMPDLERNRAIAGAKVDDKADPEKLAIWWSHYRRAIGNKQNDRQARDYADRMTATEPKFRPNPFVAKESIDLDKSVEEITEELKKAFEDYVSNEKYSDDTLYPPKNKKASVDKKKAKKPKVVDANVLGEGASSQEVGDAIAYRISRQKPELITKYGVEALADAIDQVASFHAGAEELGTSDISIMVNQVVKDLERNYVKESNEVDSDNSNYLSPHKRAELVRKSQEEKWKREIEREKQEKEKTPVKEAKFASRARSILQKKLDDLERMNKPVPTRPAPVKMNKDEKGEWTKVPATGHATDKKPLDEEDSMMPQAIQLFQLMQPKTRQDMVKYLNTIRKEYGPEKSLQTYRMAQKMKQANKNMPSREVDEAAPQIDPATGQPIQQNTTSGQQPAVNTATPITTPQTTAQQPPAPKGTPTAVPAPGQPQLPKAGQAGGAPVAPPPGTPKPETGSGVNTTTTPIQGLATSLQQLAQPGAQMAARKAADALARVK